MIDAKLPVVMINKQIPRHYPKTGVAGERNS